VLRDLMLRRWHADKEVLSVDDPEVPLEAVAERVAATLEHVKQALHEPVPASAARAPSRQPSTDRPVPASSSSDADSRSVGGVAGGTP
jgi:hypothetical protein